MKKGFTLIELVAVIIVLALLGFIIIPAVSGVIGDNREKLHIQQIEQLKKHANTYIATNPDKLKTFDGAITILTVDDLHEAGIIQNENMIDPLTEEEMAGCLVLRYKKDNKQFDIEYNETCVRNATLTGTITASNSPIVANVYLLENEEVVYETTTDASGNYSFNNVEVGRYVLLAGQQYKTNYGEEVDITESNVNKNMNITLYQPDYNDDGLVNQLDQNHYDYCYKGFFNSSDGSFPTGCFERERYDLNNDRNITTADQGLASRRYITEIKYLETAVYNIKGNINIVEELNKIPVTTKIYLKNNTQTYSADIDKNGNFSFNNIPKGKYFIEFKFSGYGAYYKYFTLDEDINLAVGLYYGDLNSDYVLDEADIAELDTILGYLKQKWYAYSVIAKYDINKDGKVDDDDMTFLKSNILNFKY